MFTKTQVKIMEIFVSKINKYFSIKEIAELLKKPYPLIHKSVKALLQDKYIIKNEKGLINLNYKENHQEISYIEALRAKETLSKDKTLALFSKDVQEKIGLEFFIFLIFGSYVEKSSLKDIDIIIIIENEEKVGEVERTLDNLAGNFTKSFHIQVISAKSAYEMLAKRDKINILNESLNKHILLFGAENYYKILQNAR